MTQATEQLRRELDAHDALSCLNAYEPCDGDHVILAAIERIMARNSAGYRHVRREIAELLEEARGGAT